MLTHRSTLLLVQITLLVAAANAAADSKPATAKEATAACKTTATYKSSKPDTIAFKIKNTTKREVRTCWLEFYVYDKTGEQLFHRSLPYGYKLKANQSNTETFAYGDLAAAIGTRKGVTVETVVSHALFTDGAEYDDRKNVPEQRPRSSKK